MAATKVYSTLLFVVAAIVSILLGFSPKFGALILSTPGPVIEDVDRPESQVRSRLAAGRKWIRTSSSCREAVNRDGRRTGCPEIGTDLLRNRRSRIHLPPAASQVQTRFRGRRWRRRARGRVMPYLAARRSSWWKSSCH
ncbi:MAG: solute carrier family 23 protein [Stellaceae bacterium]